MNLKMMMKKILLNIILIACISCFAQQGLNVYDAEGHLLTKMGSLSELNSKNCPSKRCFVAQNTGKKTNASTFIKKGYVKSKGKKRWYEVDWNQGVKLCPEKNFNSGDGIWIVNGPAHVDSVNCVYVDGSPYTRSILVLFSRNLDDLIEADSSWILVNQTIVEMSGSLSKVWIPQRDYVGAPRSKEKWKKDTLKQDLIVDKTEFTVREAFELKREVYKQECGENYTDKKKYFCKELRNEEIDESIYPLYDSTALLDCPIEISSADMKKFAIWRSERDQLNVVFPKVPFDSVVAGILLSVNSEKTEKMVMDTSKNGYRIPYDFEWTFLQSGGQQTDFFWGNDTLPARRYEWNLSDVDQLGFHIVAGREPNPFGLYDVYGNANEMVINVEGDEVHFRRECNWFSIDYTMSPTCWYQASIRPVIYGRVRELGGMRLVRKLE